MANTRQILYASPGDRTGLLVTESIMLLSVLGGVGSLPFLEERGLSWYWMVTLAAGILTILAGIWYAIRHWRRAHPVKGDTSKPGPNRLLNFVRSIPPSIRSLFTWDSEQEALLVLPRFAVLTGVLILLPTLASGWQQAQNAYLFDDSYKMCVIYDKGFWVHKAHLFEIFFCAPAFLLWIGGAVYYAFPILNIQPKHAPQIAGLAKSGLQALSALLLWVYLGLSVGLRHIDWMFWSALSLAVIGGALGIPASAGDPEEESWVDSKASNAAAPGGTGKQQAAASKG